MTVILDSISTNPTISSSVTYSQSIANLIAFIHSAVAEFGISDVWQTDMSVYCPNHTPINEQKFDDIERFFVALTQREPDFQRILENEPIYQQLQKTHMYRVEFYHTH